MPEVAESTTTTSRRRIIREQPQYTPPARTPYPDEAVLDVLLADIEDIAGGDGLASRTSELARAIWEMQGILLRRRFGDPTTQGSVGEPDPAITTRLHSIERTLSVLRRRSTDTYGLQAVSRNGAQARIETDAMIVIIDCGARVVRALREAGLQARVTGTADTEIQ